MADLEKSIKVIFGGEDKALKESISRVDTQMRNLQKSIDNVSNPLAKAGSAILKVDAALAALVAGGIALAIRESSNFNKEFALISTSVDATGTDLQRYRDDILQYSTTSVKSITDINAALYTAAQAGIQWGESLDFMSKAEQLAVANNANLNKTVDLLTGTMNAYGFSVKDVGHLNDVFFTSTLIGKQTIDQLGQSMGMVVGIAANFGVSFESLSAAISTLTAKGMETSEAITAVKGVITSIANPSKEAADAAKALGLDFSVAALKANDLEGMLAKVMTATGGNADKMKILFGETRALNGIMQLTGDELEFFNSALQKINNSTGSAEAAYKKMADTFTNQSQMMVNAAKGLLIEVGTRLEETAGKYAGSFAIMLAGITKAIDKGTFNSIFAAFDELGTILGGKLETIARLLPEALNKADFTKLIEAMRNAGDAISGALGETTADDVARAIQEIIDSVASLISMSQGIFETFGAIAISIREAMQAFNELDVSTKELVGNLMGLSVAYKYFGSLAIVFAALGTDAETANTVFNTFFAALENGFNVIKVLLYAVATAFYELIVGANKFMDMIPGLDFSKSLADSEKVLESLKGKLSAAADALVASSQKTVDAWNGTGQYADKATGKVSAYQKAISQIEAGKTTTLAVNADTNKVNNHQQAIKNVEKEKTTVLHVDTDVAKKEIDDAIPEQRRIVVGFIEDENGRKELTQTIEEYEKPISKKVDVKIDDLGVKEKSQAIQSMIEWKAKLDIAQVEAGVKKMETMFGSLNEFFKSTGDVIQSALGVFSNVTSSWDKSKIFDIIEKEQKNRTELLQTQKDLIKAEIDLAKAKADAIRSGKDIAMKITADGLEPELEAFMWRIVQKVQVRANEASAEFLLGIGSGT